MKMPSIANVHHGGDGNAAAPSSSVDDDANPEASRLMAADEEAQAQEAAPCASSAAATMRRRRSTIRAATASAELLKMGGKRRRESSVVVVPSLAATTSTRSSLFVSARNLMYGSIPSSSAEQEEDGRSVPSFETERFYGRQSRQFSEQQKRGGGRGRGGGGDDWSFDAPYLMEQIPPVVVATVLTAILGVSFGAAYFPVGWRSQESVDGGSGSSDEAGGDVDALFPLPGKETLGLRMFLFSTVACQLVLTFASEFTNPIGLQIVENVPFYHAYATLCFAEQGYGLEALSTLMVLFGLSSILVGVAFLALGWAGMGRLIYFIPRHVLVGLIGGIGIFIAEVGIEVTTDDDFTLTVTGLKMLWSKMNLFGVVIGLEGLLRILIKVTTHPIDGTPRYPLLSPLFYCLVPPFFFLALRIVGVSVKEAQDAGYFFPQVDAATGAGDGSGFIDKHTFDLFTTIDFSTVSWTVVQKSAPTMLGLVAFSLIHVPIYVPALNVSTGQEADMNSELIAHGYSNVLTGIFGGLQNYMTYSNSIAYARLGGRGKVASLAVVALTTVFFFLGPALTSYIPRCMAGVILLHLGIDLIKEALYDSYADFDRLEYGGIWFVTVVIAMFGMEPGLVAGVLSALSVYIAQSVHVQDPVRRHMDAATLRSSRWRRPVAANAILDDDIHGRRRVHIFQLQGHLFFATVAQLTADIGRILDDVESNYGKVWICILDFSLVLGLDASAAQGIAKIKDMLHGRHDVSLVVFATGRRGGKGGFPCEYQLADDLEPELFWGDHPNDETLNGVGTTTPARTSVLHRMSVPAEILFQNDPQKVIPADQVCDTLAEALEFAEDVLIARKDPSLLDDTMDLMTDLPMDEDELEETDTIVGERSLIRNALSDLAPLEYQDTLETLIPLLKREIYQKGQVVWAKGSPSDSAKFVVRGMCEAYQRGSTSSSSVETVRSGQIIGEAGLVQVIDRFSTVRCSSDHAVLYSIDRPDWEKAKVSNPRVVSCLQVIALRNLTHRLQHINNNVFEDSRSLPV